MEMSHGVSCLILMVFLGSSTGILEVNTREKRSALFPPPLVYPFGGTIKLVIGFAVPVKLAGRILVYGQNFQFQYPLPQNATTFTSLLENGRRTVARRRRELDRSGRTAFFDALEMHFLRNGLDARECLRRSICEATVDPLHNEGLMGELLHLFLTPEHENDQSFPDDLLQASIEGHGIFFEKLGDSRIVVNRKGIVRCRGKEGCYKRSTPPLVSPPSPLLISRAAVYHYQHHHHHQRQYRHHHHARPAPRTGAVPPLPWNRYLFGSY